MQPITGNKRPTIARVLFEYKPQAESELPLTDNEIIEIYQKDESGWWEGRSCTSGEVGYFPGNYVEEVGEKSEEQDGAHAVPIPPASGSALKPVAIKKQAGSRAAVKPKTGFEDFVSSSSRYGMWATNMGIGCGIGMFWASWASILICIIEPDTFDKDGNELYLNIYGVLIATMTIAFEKRWFIRTSSAVPMRALAYCFVATPMMFTQLTRIVAILYYIVALANVLSAVKGEQYIRESLIDTPQTGPAVPKISIQQHIIGFWQRTHRENSTGTVAFIILFTALNGYVAINALIYWINAIEQLKHTETALSEYAPFAKMFGNLLDLNCGIILLPVCRTFIRYLYDLSTQSQSWHQVALRGLLKLFPLDKAIYFHKRLASLIAIFTIGHTFFHFVNYGIVPENTIHVFGWWPWISGVVLFVIMLFLYGATPASVKHFHFELFWNSHQLFTLFFVFLLTHGRTGINPNVWKWLAAPMFIYIAERIYRYYSAYRNVSLTSVNNMGKVLCIQFDRDSVFPKGYKEGQYLFLNCPHISAGQWHPFTISSAPQQPQVSLHLRVMGPNSWTGKLSEYLQLMMPPNSSYVNFITPKSKGKILGPDGKQILRVYGPHSAPTQHISEYKVDMIIGAGIGVTPVSATIRSIVHHRWKFSMGATFPEHAYFFWVVSHADLDSFRWFVRVMKDADDAIFNACVKDPSMKKKTFEIHVYVTSCPAKKTGYSRPKDVDDIAFWGVHQEDIADSVERVSAPWTEDEMFRTLKDCPESGSRHGSVRVYNGRPLWDERFQEVYSRHAGQNIGVAFCGNPRVGKDLKKVCSNYSSPETGTSFKLHRENF